MSPSDATRVLASRSHGVLGTVHEERGIDMTPTVYATHDGFVGSPIDRVKPKSSYRLQRLENLRRDPRATLLVEHWDRDDWSGLWWVRAELRWTGEGAGDRADLLARLLAAEFVQYEDQPFAGMLVFEIVRTIGWSATAMPG